MSQQNGGKPEEMEITTVIENFRILNIETDASRSMCWFLKISEHLQN